MTAGVGYKWEGLAGLLKVVISRSLADLLIQPSPAPTQEAEKTAWASLWAVVGPDPLLTHSLGWDYILCGLGFYKLLSAPRAKSQPTEARRVVASLCKWGQRSWCSSLGRLDSVSFHFLVFEAGMRLENRHIKGLVHCRVCHIPVPCKDSSSALTYQLLITPPWPSLKSESRRGPCS